MEGTTGFGSRTLFLQHSWVQECQAGSQREGQGGGYEKEKRESRGRTATVRESKLGRVRQRAEQASWEQNEVSQHPALTFRMLL